MPSIPIHLPSQEQSSPSSNPLPSLLQTPSGLALVELQGTIHSSGISLSQDHHENENEISDSHADSSQLDTDSTTATHKNKTTQIGRLVFPDYTPSSTDGSQLHSDDKKWMKRVYLYVGKHQRMSGEVLALKNAVAVVRRRRRTESNAEMRDAEIEGPGDDDKDEELEIIEIVKYKIVFASRPEPVGTEEVAPQT